MPTVIATTANTQTDWPAALAEAAALEPLIATNASLRGLAHVGRRAPDTVMIGIGLCSRDRLSGGLPIDILGMLLPAERCRQAIGAANLVALVADTHAETNGIEASRVARLAVTTEDLLLRIRSAFRLGRLIVTRASALHRSAAYGEVLAEVEARAPRGTHPYVTRQVADVAHLHRRGNGLLKVGWTLGDKAAKANDETVFDGFTKRWLADEIGFVYCRAGRALDDQRPKAAPYVAHDASTRVLLSANEDAAAKLGAARSRLSGDTLRGAARYYKSLIYTFNRQVAPVRGTLGQRLQAIVDLAVSGYAGLTRLLWATSRLQLDGASARRPEGRYGRSE